jgi:RHS repeat-associated protein
LNNQRVKTILSKNSTVERIKYFHGDYEEDSTATGTKKYHYINAPNGLTAIFVKEGSADTLYHVLTDHLGSLNGVINAETDDVTYYSYNAWGKPRDPDDWTSDFSGELFAGRGYTGHEHLSEFNLINMNGRVYDPILARFLSPDPIVQYPGLVDGLNRYSYVMNNPLIFTVANPKLKLEFRVAILLQNVYILLSIVNILINIQFSI